MTTITTQTTNVPGTVASPGLARGPVQHVDGLDDDALEGGAILVLSEGGHVSAAAIARAAGLVLGTGGALSSVATVARELGIPALVGVVDADDLLLAGQLVEVDAERGVVAPVQD